MINFSNQSDSSDKSLGTLGVGTSSTPIASAHDRYRRNQSQNAGYGEQLSHFCYGSKISLVRCKRCLTFRENRVFSYGKMKVNV